MQTVINILAAKIHTRFTLKLNCEGIGCQKLHIPPKYSGYNLIVLISVINTL